MWPEGVRVHMIGIGGAGMSSLARYLRGAGAAVSGTDLSASAPFRALSRDGFRVSSRQDGSLLEEGADLAVCTAAATEENPEIRFCRRRGIPLVRYSEMLGRLMSLHEGIAVAGTHGKTTVSAVLAYLLGRCGKDPSFVIGGTVPCLGGVGGARGGGKHLVAEACEFARSFLHLDPFIAVVTNIEEDHLDCYKDIADLRRAFKAFLSRRREGGEAILADSIPEPPSLAGSGRPLTTFGFKEGSSFRAVDLDADREGTTFRLLLKGDSLGVFRVPLPGRHNVLNATAALAASLRAGCAAEDLRAALPGFSGVARRMERLGEFGSVILYSDYAHHPSEIAAVREALHIAHPGRRLVVLFQAHQRSRTAYFLDGLSAALAAFDLSFVVETFSVREKDVDHLPGGRDLCDAVKNRGGSSRFVGSLAAASDRIMGHLRKGDVLVLMGAGSIDDIARSIEENLRLL